MYKLEFSHVFVLFFICYAAYWVSCCISGKFVVAYTVVCAYPTNVSVPGLSGACDTCDIGRPPDDLCTGISVTGYLQWLRVRGNDCLLVLPK